MYVPNFLMGSFKKMNGSCAAPQRLIFEPAVQLVFSVLYILISVLGILCNIHMIFYTVRYTQILWIKRDKKDIALFFVRIKTHFAGY